MISDILFWVFGLAACCTAIAVVISQNVVRMAFWLILSLGSTAGLFFLLNADFVGTAQLLVYVGGTLVLLIFGVMLTASGPFINMKTSPADGLVAGLVGFSLLGLLLSSACSVNWEALASANPPGNFETPGSSDLPGYNTPQEGNTTRALGFSFLGLRPDRDLHPATDGKPSVGYLLPFEIASVHLLVVLVGAAYLARAKKRKDRPAGPRSSSEAVAVRSEASPVGH